MTPPDPRVSMAALVSLAGLLVAMVCLGALLVIAAVRRRRQKAQDARDTRARQRLAERIAENHRRWRDERQGGQAMKCYDLADALMEERERPRDE